MWCPRFVMYNHKQLEFMKKVLMMLCAVLALASCSKEATEPQEQRQEQKKQQPTTPISLSLSATISDLDAKALDHQLDGNKLKHFLNGKTELRVRTLIWNEDAPRWNDDPLFNNTLVWKVAEDGKTIYFDGQIDIYVADLNPSTAKIRLTAFIGKHPWGGEDSADNEHIYPKEEAAKPRLAGDKFSITTPYVLRTKLQLTTDHKLLYNTKQPEADRRFKPEGSFLRFKIRNELGTQVKITHLFYLRPSGSIQCFHHRYTIRKMADSTASYSDGAFIRNYNKDVKNIPLPQPIVLDPGKTTEAEFLYWMPTPYALIHPDVVLDDPGLLYHTTMQLQKQKLEDYEEGKVYRTTLVLRKLHNPLEYIAEYPMNATGTGMLTSLPAGYPHPAVSPNKFQPYAEVGYFNEREAKEKFGAPKKYPGGGDDVWHLPSEAELRSIFGSLGKDSGNAGSLSLVEWVQLGNYKTRIGSHYYNRQDLHTVVAKRFTDYGVGNYESNYVPKTGFYTPFDPHQNLEEKHIKLYRTETPEWPLEISNRICFAFRYKLIANRTLEVTAKYVGFNEIDLHYLSSQNESWWKDRNSVTRVFPAYSLEVNTYDYAETLYDYLLDLGGMRSNGSAVVYYDANYPLQTQVTTQPKCRSWKIPVYLFRTIND